MNAPARTNPHNIDMTAFGHNLVPTYSDADDKWVLGVAINGTLIHDLRMSECGRFSVDPQTHGFSSDQANQLAMINAALEKAIDDGLNAACLSIQNFAGVEHGDMAAHFFSDSDMVKRLGEPIAKYMAFELNHQIEEPSERPTN